MKTVVQFFGSPKTAPLELRCSFCHKTQSEVAKLIAGPDTFICDECVQVCVEIMRAGREIQPGIGEARPEAAAAAASPTYPTSVVRCRLCDQDALWDQALEIPERGYLCPRCSGEVDVALAQKYGTGPISD